MLDNQSIDSPPNGTNLTTYEQDLRRRVTTFPNDAQSWFYLGSYLRRQKKYHESETALRRAIELNSAPPHFIIELGLLLEEMGRPSEAEKVLQLLGRSKQRLAIAKEVAVTREVSKSLIDHDVPSPCIECHDYTYYGCSRSAPCAKFIVWRASTRGH
jgi:tetratricopeptide (TPR) repeat protein